MHVLITSTQNPKIKSLLALEKPRDRKREGLFVIEGQKEINLAIQSEYSIETLFFCEDIISIKEVEQLASDAVLIPISKEVFGKIAIREGSGGVIAIAKQKKHELASIKLSKNPIVLILESVEKPGNLGAILRTADAAGIDAVIICDQQTDFYNPNVIRSSIGCVFSNQVAAASTQETIAWLKHNKLAIYCTYLQASKPYHLIDYTQPCAIVMGTEATGLSQLWVDNADGNIIIPMQGKIDSLNVSTATAIVVFEAKRQRGFSL